MNAKVSLMRSPSQSMSLDFYVTPTGVWVESPHVVLDTAVQPVKARGAVRTRGSVTDRALRDLSVAPSMNRGYLRGVDLSWDFTESPEGTALFLEATSMLPRGSTAQIIGTDGRSQARRLLNNGFNGISMITSDGRQLMIVVKVHRLDETGSGRSGVVDYMEKQKILQESLAAVQKHRDDYLSRGIRHVKPVHGILTLGELTGVLEKATRIGQDLHPATSALIAGETGTGKELIAHLIYRRWLEELRRIKGENSRVDIPFEAINCSTIGGDTNIQLSALFGRIPGYLSPDDMGEAGCFLRACGYEWKKDKSQWHLVKTKDDGVLFLDEIGELYPGVQGKLLRVLEERKVKPLGYQPVAANPKLVFATDKDISDHPKFRKQLWYRINVNPLELPPLRNRKDVIPHLVYYFTDQHFSERNSKRQVEWDVEAVTAMTAYSWPGNIRELKNVVSNLLIFGGSRNQITLGELHKEIRRNYEELKRLQQPEHLKAKEKVTQLAKALFGEVFETGRPFPPEAVLQQMVDLKLEALRCWLETEQNTLLAQEHRNGCHGYLSKFLGDREKAKDILREVVSVLGSNGQNMSSEEEERSGLRRYTIFKRFFGLSYRSFSK
jgi:DNA-binding NtrC family response regulator